MNVGNLPSNGGPSRPVSAIAHLVPLRYVTFDDGQDVVEGRPGHPSSSQARHVAQSQPSRVLSIRTVDVEALQLTHTGHKLTADWRDASTAPSGGQTRDMQLRCCFQSMFLYIYI